MSTSSEPRSGASAWAVEAFRYPLISDEAETMSSMHGLDADEVARVEQRAYDSGSRDGEERARRQYEQALNCEREALMRAVREFERERKQYYKRVEAEVVQLAMAIARKVLHRESQVDPVLLAGLVGVALQRLDDQTPVRLRVSVQDAAAWRRYLERSEYSLSVQIIEDSSLEHDHCILETELGRTELSVEAELKEIEQGLFDLLAQNPGERP